jgi:WD40 repeat protein
MNPSRRLWFLGCGISLVLTLCVLTVVPAYAQSPRDTVIDLAGDTPPVEDEAVAPLDHGSWRIIVEKEFNDLDVHFTVLRFSHDGKTLCAAGEYGECILWDTANWKELHRLKRHPIVWDVAFSADDKQLLTCGEDGNLVLWNLATGEVVKEFRGHKNAVRSCAISPDGKQIMGGGGRGFGPAAGQSDTPDHSVRIWDGATGKQTSKLDGHSADVTTVAFLPDKNQVLSAGLWDDMLIVWDIAAEKAERVISGIERDGVVEYIVAAVSPNGKHAITCGSAMFNGMLLLDEEIKPHVRRWDLATGKQDRDYGPNTRGEGHAAFGPLPGTFVTVDLDWRKQDDDQNDERADNGQVTYGTVRVRDVASGEVVTEFIRGGPRFDGSSLAGPIAASSATKLIACTQSAGKLVVLKLEENEAD